MLQLQEAVISGDNVSLEHVLEEKEVEKDWKWRGKEGRTALELASMLGHSGMVGLLVGAGAPPNLLSASGKSSMSVHPRMLCIL